MRKFDVCRAAALGNDQTVTDVEFSKVAQFGIAPLPVARCQIALEALKLRTDVRQATERGYSCSNLFVKIRFWSLPIRAEETVDATARDCQRLHINSTKHGAKQIHRRENPAIDRKNLREVVPSQPEVLRRGIPCENDDAVLCNAGAFLETASLVLPMVHCKDGEYDVECLVLKGQRLGNRLYSRRGGSRALTEHYGGWFDSDNSASDRFV